MRVDSADVDVGSDDEDLQPTDVAKSQEAKQPNSTLPSPVYICSCDEDSKLRSNLGAHGKKGRKIWSLPQTVEL